MQGKIRQAILNLLARRDYSQRELLQTLQKKGHAADDIIPVLAGFVQTGLINETRFTENYIRWRAAKGYGPLRILQELQIRGITAEMIADQLQIADNAWFIAARQVWQKHFKGNMPKDFKNRAKQMRFLQYRGFTREQIADVFSPVEAWET